MRKVPTSHEPIMPLSASNLTDPEGGAGGPPDPPPPVENRIPLKLIKLPSQHSKLSYHRHASETNEMAFR